MSDLIDKFSHERRVLDSISPQRELDVRLALSRLQASAGVPLTEIQPDHLRTWMIELLESGLQPSTVGKQLHQVTPFCRWLWREGHISADHFLRLQEVKPPRGYRDHKPRPYSRKELIQMWSELDAKFPLLPEDTRLLVRYRNGTSRLRGRLKRHVMRIQLDAIIELALVCGLRQKEIYRLSIDDCHPDNKYIVVHGKRVNQNAKVRDVPYPESTRQALLAWFRLRALIAPPPGSPVWLSVTGPNPAAPLNEDRMENILSFGNWTLHRLRHTAATERLRAGMKLEDLQAFLGHANLQQTLAYAEIVRDDVHKASERIDADFQAAVKPHLRRAA